MLNKGAITIANAVFGSKPPISGDVLAKAFQVEKKMVDWLQDQFCDWRCVVGVGSSPPSSSDITLAAMVISMVHGFILGGCIGVICRYPRVVIASSLQ
ncbi:hypothetical protein EJB05_09578, partial [Eragrostis curvula]